MKRKISLMLAVMLLTALIPTAGFAASGSADGVRTDRALCLGSGDYSGSSSDLSPGPENDSKYMYNMFKKHGIAATRITNSSASTLSKLKSKINSTFASADDDDVSYFTFSGHGAYSGGNAYIILTGGEAVSASDLAGAFSNVKGTVVLMIDSCFSGGLIDKSADAEEAEEKFSESFCSAFEGVTERGTALNTSRFKVICASSSEEVSWQASSGGYFSIALTTGCGYSYSTSSYNEVPADTNRDSQVSLTEIREFIEMSNISSHVRTFPESDAFSILNYKPTTGKLPSAQLVSAPVVDYNAGKVTFKIKSYSATTAKVSVYSYGTKNFDKLRSSTLYMTKSLGISTSGLKYTLKNKSYTLTAGKTKTISIPLSDLTTRAYAMHITVSGQKYAPTAYFSVYKGSSSSVKLSLSGRMNGPEFQLRATCKSSQYLSTANLTCIVQNSSGKTVRNLGTQVAAQGIANETGSSTTFSSYRDFYWDGLDDDGNTCPSGTYTFYVKAVYNGGSKTVSGSINANIVTPSQNDGAPEITNAYITPDKINYTSGASVKFNVTLKDAAKLTIKVYNSSGKAVRTLASGVSKSAGTYTYKWDLKKTNGNVPAAGWYYIAAAAQNDDGQYNYTLAWMQLTKNATKPKLTSLKYTSSQTLKYPCYSASDAVRLYFNLDQKAKLTCKVYNSSGTLVSSFSNTLSAGSCYVQWVGKNNKGTQLKSGTYTFKIYAENSVGKSNTLSAKVKVTMKKR